MASEFVSTRTTLFSAYIDDALEVNHLTVCYVLFFPWNILLPILPWQDPCGEWTCGLGRGVKAPHGRRCC